MGYVLRDGRQRQQELLDELDRITAILRARDVEKVIVFGSLARGETTATSDIDLIVIQETDKGFLDRIGEIYSAVTPRKAVDILAYTPQEIRYLEGSSSFVRKALSEGRVLYEKDPC